MDGKKILSCLAATAAIGVLGVIGVAVVFFVANEEEYRDELTMPGTEGAGYAVGGLGSWNGAAHLECSGNESATISGVTSVLPTGPVVRAGGNCQLSLVNCNITGPVAVEASGNASVTITGGSITGSQNSIVATGNGTVVVQGAAVAGATQSSANGTITGVQ